MTFKRILVAVDQSEIAAHAIVVGLELAVALAAEVAFVHVIPPAFSDGSGFAAAQYELAKPPDYEILKILDALAARVSVPTDAAKFVPIGDPTQSIVRVAGDWPADLVVIGSHGRDGVGRVLLGSVAEGVVRHAPCPVLVVRK